MTIRPLTADDTAVGAARLRGVFDAHRVITSDLGLASMLDRIVAAACELVDARYGALAVIAADGSLERLVQHGFDVASRSRLDDLPRDRGRLGSLFTEPDVLRIDDLSTDPRSDGYPTFDPPLRSFLGVPIRVRGAAFGELYLADAEPGRFDAACEDLVTALAATAGSAIENARLYDESRRSRDWLTASGEIARALLADADEQVLLDVVSRALSVAGADYASLILPTDDGRLRVVVTEGVGAEAFKGYVFEPAASTLGRAILAGEGLRTHDMLLWAKEDFHNIWDFGPAMIAPLVDSLGTRGAVLLIRTAGRLPFDRQDVELASTFATQVALALQLNDARGDAEWLRVIEDRHRIAQDLHDNVIQRLFATGVGLQAAADSAGDAELGARLHGFVADLDETIEQIRTRVFGLRNSAPPQLRHPRGRYPRVSRPARA